MKIANYARVSSDTQKKDGTIESQIEALKDYAKQHKHDIAFECLDDGYSGTTLDRPGLDQVRDLAQTGSIEGVLILSPDRLSRNQANQIILLEEFKKRDVQLILTNQNFENNAEGNLMLQIQGAVAEYERTKILDRMRRGIIHATKKGQINGNNPPLGYRYIAKSKDSPGHWEVNLAEADIVRYIYDLYVNKGLKGTKIAKRMNDEYIHCRGSKWWGARVYAILKNETYTGTAYMFKNRSVEPKKYAKSNTYRRKKNSGVSQRPREEWIGVSVTPIIDVQTWNKAQELLQRNAKQSQRNNNVNHYLLRGLVVCGLCGSIASGYVSNKSTYYSCRAKRGKSITTRPHDETVQVKHKPFDDRVWVGLTELLSDPESLRVQLEKRMQAKTKGLPSSKTDNDFDKELGQLAAQEKRILDAYREEVISLGELKAQKEKISSRRKVLDAKRKVALGHTESLREPQITMDMLLGDVSARFKRVMAKANFKTREKLANLLINSVTLLTDKAIVKGNIPITKLDVTKLDALETRRQRASYSINCLNGSKTRPLFWGF